MYWIRDREVERTGGARDIAIADRVYSDAEPRVVPAAAEIRGIEEQAASGIELRYKRIHRPTVRNRLEEGQTITPSPTTEGRLEGSWGCREVRRHGKARDVRGAHSIYDDAKGLIRATATEVGGIDERAACRIKFRHEGISETAAKGGLEAPHGRRKVHRLSKTGNVSISGGIQRDAGAFLKVAAAQEGGVNEPATRRI